MLVLAKRPKASLKSQSSLSLCNLLINLYQLMSSSFKSWGQSRRKEASLRVKTSFKKPAKSGKLSKLMLRSAFKTRQSPWKNAMWPTSELYKNEKQLLERISMARRKKMKHCNRDVSTISLPRRGPYELTLSMWPGKFMQLPMNRIR